MLKIKYHSSFKRDYKRLKKHGMNMDLLHEAISWLAKNAPLPEHYRDHALTCNLKGYRYLHITPDWRLIYKIVGCMTALSIRIAIFRLNHYTAAPAALAALVLFVPGQSTIFAPLASKIYMTHFSVCAPFHFPA